MKNKQRSLTIEQLVYTYSDTIYRIAITSLKSKADAEDIVQTVLIKYLESNVAFESEEHQKAWLIRVALNECNNYYRSSWIKKVVPLMEWQDGVVQAHEINHVHKEVLSLPQKYKIPIHLHYFEGYSIKEIASILATKESTIKTWLSRGREQLKVKMEGEC